MEPSSSGSGVVQIIKDGLKSDEKLSAAELQNLTLRSETSSSTEKVADRDRLFDESYMKILNISVRRQWRFRKAYGW